MRRCRSRQGIARTTVAVAVSAILGCSLGGLTGAGDAGSADGGANDASVTPDADAGLDVADAPTVDGVAGDAADSTAFADVVPPDSPAVGCGTTVVVSGTPTSMVVYLSSSVDGGHTWTSVPVTGGMTTLPSIVATSTGFAALYAEGDGQLVLTTYSIATATWSTPSLLGASLTSPNAASLALLGGTLHGVFRGEDETYYHVTEGTPFAVEQISPSAGLVGPTLANLGGSLTAALSLGDADGGLLGDDTFVLSLDMWTPYTFSAVLGPAAPHILALSSNAQNATAAIVFVDSSFEVSAIAQVGGSWTSPMVYTQQSGTLTAIDVAATALDGGGVGIVYLPGPGLTQAAVLLLTPQPGPEPFNTLLFANFGPTTTQLPSTPTIAQGACGDAVIVAYGTGTATEVLHVSPLAEQAATAVVTGPATLAAIATSP